MLDKPATTLTLILEQQRKSARMFVASKEQAQ
jgi:hypothetical protein